MNQKYMYLYIIMIDNINFLHDAMHRQHIVLVYMYSNVLSASTVRRY